MRSRLLAFVFVCSLTACTGGDATPKADSTAAAPAAAASVAPQVITISAKEFAYEAPDTIQSGAVTLKLINNGAELHHVQLLKLSDGKTYADLMAGFKAMKPTDAPPPWIHDVAGPNTPVPGGGNSEITETLEPGDYAIICFIPSADHIPHAMKGMMKSLTVVPATGAAATLPTADISVTMADYAWTVTPDITAGKHIIKIENTAEQSHEMLLVQLAPGKTVAEFAAWTENRKGPPPATPMGGITGMAKGGIVYEPVDLTPGEYGLICFLPDAKDGKPHVAHGMLKQFTVK